MTNSRNKVKKLRKELLAELKVPNCPSCGIKMAPSHHNAPNSITLDHVIPISEGGVTNRENVQIMCKACNNRKLSAANKLAIILRDPAATVEEKLRAEVAELKRDRDRWQRQAQMLKQRCSSIRGILNGLYDTDD